MTVSRTITTAGAGGTWNSSTAATTITSLKSTMASGKIVYAADINDLITLWNNFSGHTHNISQDLYGLKDYGSTNPPGYAGPPDGSNNPNITYSAGFTGGLSTIPVGFPIYAATTAQIITAMGGAGSQLSHTHNWNDQDS